MSLAKQIQNNHKDTVIILFVADIFPYIKDRGKLHEYRIEMHQRIVTLANDFDNVELWFKHHPRNNYNIRLHNVNEDKTGNIKQFFSDHDTNLLISKCDIYISQLSSVTVSPILLKKPVIIYDEWKELLPNAKTIFDLIKYKAKNIKELSDLCHDILSNGYNFTDDDVIEFCKTVYPIRVIGDTMTDNYVSKIMEIIEK